MKSNLIEAHCSNYKPILGYNITNEEGRYIHLPKIGRLSKCINSTQVKTKINNCIECTNKSTNKNKVMEELTELINYLSNESLVAKKCLQELIDDYPIPAIIILNKLKEYDIKGVQLYTLIDICEKDFDLMAYLCNKAPKDILILASDKSTDLGQSILKEYIDKFYTD